MVSMGGLIVCVFVLCSSLSSLPHQVWREQAELSQKNLETLKLRTSEEIEELRRTLHDERQKWKDAETNFELEILRLKDEGAATIREKNVRPDAKSGSGNSDSHTYLPTSDTTLHALSSHHCCARFRSHDLLMWVGTVNTSLTALLLIDRHAAGGDCRPAQRIGGHPQCTQV